MERRDEEPTEGTGRKSVVKLPRFWYVAAASEQVGTDPLPFTLGGRPLVLFRGEGGRAGALLDRCPHRNVPLSAGRVREQRLECAYHGWQFDPDGVCVRIPGLSREPEEGRRRAVRFATCEKDGYLWVWGAPDEEPEGAPPSMAAPAGHTSVRRSVDFPGTLHATVENALDVPHTAFLHRGLFRGTGRTNEIKAVVTRTPRSVQAEYVGEPRPEGLAGRILAPSGGIVEHWDRFFLPSLVEVEYRLGSDAHILTRTAFTPIDDFMSRAWAVISFRVRIPGFLIRPLFGPVAMRIFRQDAWILKLQTETIQRFDGERFTSTEIDVLGGQIWRLMTRAAAGEFAEDEQEYRREIPLQV